MNKDNRGPGCRTDLFFALSAPSVLIRTVASQEKFHPMAIAPNDAITLHRFEFSSMGCPCALQVEADATGAQRAAAAVRAEVDRLDRKYSHYRDDSLVAQIGASADAGENIVLDVETADLIDFAATPHTQSEGRFDVTAGALT